MRFAKKFSILLILQLSVVFSGYAVTNYITLQVNNSWNYTCNTTTLLETDQTITNAFTLHVLNNSNAATIYVNISAWNYPVNWVPVANYPLQTIYVSDNSPNATNIATTVTPTTSNLLLFKQPKHTGGTPYDFNYNLKLLALGYSNYIPGNYNFTLTFTMTEP